MAKYPWFKFYPNDWLADEQLSVCSRAAKGLWIDMLSLMHKSQQRGVLPFEGLDRAAERLSKQIGGSPDAIRPLLAELIDEAVATVSDDGRFIVSRRMVRETHRAEVNAENGRKGGNPLLIGDSLNPPDKPPDNRSDKQVDKRRSSFWPLVSDLLPMDMRTEEMRLAWEAWEQHRRERKPRITKTSAGKQAKKLAEMGHDRAIAAIEHSIAGGYQGIFEPNPGRGGGANRTGAGQSGNSRPTQREREAARGEFPETGKLPPSL